MSDKTRTANFRMIARPAEREAILTRLRGLCQAHGMTYTVSQDEPYWKIPDRTETTVELLDCPTLNYGKWSYIYHSLFGCEFTIEWESDESILFFTYPSAKEDSLWVSLLISAPCFWPKPSKDIRH